MIDVKTTVDLKKMISVNNGDHDESRLWSRSKFIIADHRTSLQQNVLQQFGKNQRKKWHKMLKGTGTVLPWSIHSSHF